MTSLSLSSSFLGPAFVLKGPIILAVIGFPAATTDDISAFVADSIFQVVVRIVDFTELASGIFRCLG